MVDEAVEQLGYLGCLEMRTRYVRHSAAIGWRIGLSCDRTCTVVELLHLGKVVQQLGSLLFDAWEGIVGVIVVHNHPHQIEQCG